MNEDRKMFLAFTGAVVGLTAYIFGVVTVALALLGDVAGTVVGITAALGPFWAWAFWKIGATDS